MKAGNRMTYSEEDSEANYISNQYSADGVSIFFSSCHGPPACVKEMEQQKLATYI